MDTKYTPVSELRLGDHACLFYANRHAQVSVAALFIMKGLLRGERCIYIADDNPVVHIWNALRAVNVRVTDEIRRGSLQFYIKRDTYLRSGRFEAGEMMTLLKKTEKAAQSAGFKGLCATGEMSWAAGDPACCERLIDYEHRCAAFYRDARAVGLCQYNRNLFSPSFLKRAGAMHPTQLSRRVYQRGLAPVRSPFSR